MDAPAMALNDHQNPSLYPGWERPDLSVVVVNYRRWEDSARLIRDLRASQSLRQGRAEIILVDNHSPAHPLMARLRRAPDVSLRRWGSNKGFSRAVNEGCRLGRGDWILLLNPDMTAPRGFLDRVLARAAELPSHVGITGFHLRDSDGQRQLSAGRFPTLLGTLLGLLRPRRSRKYSHVSSGRVDWVTGCCLLIRRECLEQVGGLDPDFFLYYEDVDLCQRAAQAGWQTHLHSGADLVHHTPLHTRCVPPHLRLITRHALLTYARKHWPGWQLPLLGGIVRLETAVRRLAAWWRCDREASDTFQQLDRMVADLVAGRVRQAYRRVVQIVRQEEANRADSPEHRHSKPLPCRFAETVPGECSSARA